METNRYIKISRILLVVLLLLLPAYLLVRTYGYQPAKESEEAAFVGKQGCVECHEVEYRDWLQSHHNKAMDYATGQSVRGDFNDVSLVAQGHTHHFYKKEGRYMVQTDGPDGTMQDFEVKYVFGYTPLQQYLVEFPGGRLQTLPLTWDTENQRWYHMADAVYANQKIDHRNWLHWTNQAQNWNSMCADCHSTNLVKGYHPDSDSYNTTWSEINVSCEACHGPGSRHVEWAALPDYAREDIPNYGLVVKTSGIDHTEYVNTCVRCHSRRASLQDFHHAEGSIYDHMVPNLPEDPTWYIDGQILEEDYVYASFTQSRMYMKGVQCNDCHNVHSGRLLYGNEDEQYNRLCAQCHIPEIYDTPAHHFHKTRGMSGEGLTSESGMAFGVGSGALCINCHMHGRNYMGVDYRRDHSFRIPRPDLSIKYGVPNACNQCHTDKSNQWAEAYVTEWFGQSRRYHFAEAFALARDQDSLAVDQLISISDDALYPPSIRALALQHLGTYFQDTLKKVVGNTIANSDATIRHGALSAIQLNSEMDVQALLPFLNDEVKALRTEAARMLSALAPENIPVRYRVSYQKALKEYEEILVYNVDFPAGKINMGNYYYNRGDYAGAVRYYSGALEQDSELIMVKLNMAYCYNRLGQNGKAEEMFEDYLKLEPYDAQALYSYGLLLSEIQQYDRSLQMMTEAYAIDATRPRVAHNIAMMYDFKGDKVNAEVYLKKEIQLMKDYNSQAELLRFYLQNRMLSKALNQAKQLKSLYPDVQELDQVIEQLK